MPMLRYGTVNFGHSSLLLRVRVYASWRQSSPCISVFCYSDAIDYILYYNWFSMLHSKQFANCQTYINLLIHEISYKEWYSTRWRNWMYNFPTVANKRLPLPNVRSETMGWMNWKANTMTNAKIQTNGAIKYTWLEQKTQ